RAGARRAVVVDVDDRDAGEAELVDGLLTGGGVAVAVGGDGLLDLGVIDARVVERLRPRLLHHVGVVPLAPAGLLELGHADADDEHLVGHGFKQYVVGRGSRQLAEWTFPDERRDYPGGRGSLGRPSTRSPTMLRCTWAVPPQMVDERWLKKFDVHLSGV